MNQIDRYTASKQRLLSIASSKGLIYALGICIGMLARLSVHDLKLFKELEARANDCNKH